MLFLEGQEPSWTSVRRNQSPLATTTPSMGDRQPVFPGLTQFQGARASYLTSPRLSFPICKTPIHRVMVGPLDAVHGSHHCTQLPKCQDLSSTAAPPLPLPVSPRWKPHVLNKLQSDHLY